MQLLVEKLPDALLTVEWKAFPRYKTGEKILKYRVCPIIGDIMRGCAISRHFHHRRSFEHASKATALYTEDASYSEFNIRYMV